MKKWAFVFCLLELFAAGAVKAAYIDRDEVYKYTNEFPWVCEIKIRIRGNIQKGDAERLIKIADDLYKRCPDLEKQSADGLFWKLKISFDSAGGDVSEAIAIGKFIRSKQWFAEIGPKQKCLSACVLSFAAALDKSVEGTLGIHRPYATHIDSDTTIEKISELRKSVKKQIYDYLDSIDIPLTLFDAMDSVPPEQMKVLDKQEIAAFKLTGRDPSYDELRVAMEASYYGIPSGEYRKRLAQSKKICPDQEADCVLSTILQVSKGEAKSRDDAVRARCYRLDKNIDSKACGVEIYKNGP